MRELKLFVWRDELFDYTASVTFALAENVNDARDLVRVADPIVSEGKLAAEPEVYTEPFALAVWGGS